MSAPGHFPQSTLGNLGKHGFWPRTHCYPHPSPSLLWGHCQQRHLHAPALCEGVGDGREFPLMFLNPGR